MVEGNWFVDETLGQVMQTFKVWPVLSSILSQQPNRYIKEYVDITCSLSKLPSWQLSIKAELLTRITAFFRTRRWCVAEKYNAMLRSVQQSDSGNYPFTDDKEMAISSILMALARAWKEFDFAGS